MSRQLIEWLSVSVCRRDRFRGMKVSHKFFHKLNTFEGKREDSIYLNIIIV